MLTEREFAPHRCLHEIGFDIAFCQISDLSTLKKTPPPLKTPGAQETKKSNQTTNLSTVKSQV